MKGGGAAIRGGVAAGQLVLGVLAVRDPRSAQPQRRELEAWGGGAMTENGDQEDE